VWHATRAGVDFPGRSEGGFRLGEAPGEAPPLGSASGAVATTAGSPKHKATERLGLRHVRQIPEGRARARQPPRRVIERRRLVRALPSRRSEKYEVV
jgi:hypothetical protein